MAGKLNLDDHPDRAVGCGDPLGTLTPVIRMQLQLIGRYASKSHTQAYLFPL
jgi:hypothetical protein